MKVIRNDIIQANNILKEHEGFNVRLWSYSSTFNVIELMLDLKDNEDIIFITFTNCTYFKGKLDWAESVLRINQSEGVTEINDFKSDFQIKAKGGFILKKGSVKDFFGDPPNDLPKLPWEQNNT